VLDRRLNPRSLGAAAGLYPGSAGIAQVSPIAPELTAERFLPILCHRTWEPRNAERAAWLRWRPDMARLPDFLRRADHQVKIRNFRIEPGDRSHTQTPSRSSTGCDCAQTGRAGNGLPLTWSRKVAAFDARASGRSSPRGCLSLHGPVALPAFWLFCAEPERKTGSICASGFRFAESNSRSACSRVHHSISAAAHLGRDSRASSIGIPTGFLLRPKVAIRC